MESISKQTIRGYEIGERIGSGGYGAVYRATQLSVNRDVAIKVILPQYANDPQFVADFEAEAKLVAQLEHTNIVPLHDYWQDEQGAFLVMRYVRGGSLKDMIEQQGALPLARIVRLIEQIAEALAVAHDVGVVHRDLKPANILIDQRGNAYLTDFGIAKQLSGDDASAKSGTVKGTFAYMAPEQIQGEAVSPQSDIYALGFMLYEMLAGQHPFYDTPIGTLLIKHIQEPLPNIHEVRDDLSPEINRIIQRATAKPATDRYENTLEMVADLKAVVEGTAPPALSVAPKKKPTTAAERNRQAVLTNVRKFWVEGVLENSLHDAAMIDLGLKPESGAVDNPWDTLIRTPSGDESLNEERIIDVFDRMNGKLLILGDPGSGKTTTLLVLARDLLNRAESDDANPMPFVLNLSSWSEKQPPLTEWLVEELNAKYQVPRKVGQAWVEGDELLLLLDGLDEVAAAVRDACVEAINTYRSEHGFVDVVVCSRINDYEALSGQLKLNGAIVIQPLDETQVHAYLDALGSNVAIVKELIQRDHQLRELAHTPLTLSIMVIAFQGMSIDDVLGFENMEDQRRHLFDIYVTRAFEREPDSIVYPVAYVRHQLGWLARQMQNHGQSIFQIEGLQPNWLGGDRSHHFSRLYTVTLVSMSYIIWTVALVFALLTRDLELQQLIVRSLLGGALGLGFGVAFSNKAYSRWWMTLVFGATMVVGLMGVGEVFVSALIGAISLSAFYWISANFMKNKDYSPLTVTPVESRSFSWANVRYIPTIIAILVITTSLVQLQSPHQFPDRLIIAHLVILPISGAFLTFFAGLRSVNVGDSSQPNRAIWRSIQNGFKNGSIGATGHFLPILVSQIILNDLTTALLEGTYGVIWVFWWVGFLFGFAPAIQHLILRWMLHRRVGIPWNYAAFLDHAARLILLRRVGGSYTFIHRSLLEYFAALELEKETP